MDKEKSVKTVANPSSKEETLISELELKQRSIKEE